MRYLVFALALLGATATSARAQDAIPDLKGTWSGKGKSIVFGTNPHHPGSQTPADPPRVRDIEATYVVDGQEGRLAWGRSWSTAANTQEPFAWAIANDNKTIVGADMDGYFRITLISPDSIEKCYTHNGTSPTHLGGQWGLPGTPQGYRSASGLVPADINRSFATATVSAKRVGRLCAIRRAKTAA